MSDIAKEEAGRRPDPWASLKLVGKFAIQSILASANFIFIYLIALVLGAIIHGLNFLFETEGWLALTGAYVERGLVGFDLALLAASLVFELLRFVKGQWAELQDV